MAGCQAGVPGDSWSGGMDTGAEGRKLERASLEQKTGGGTVPGGGQGQQARLVVGV